MVEKDEIKVQTAFIQTFEIQCHINYKVEDYNRRGRFCFVVHGGIKKWL